MAALSTEGAPSRAGGRSSHAYGSDGSGGGSGSSSRGRGGRGASASGGGSGGSVTGGSEAILQRAGPLSWPRVWLGLLAESVLLPPAVAATLLGSDIVWAGITYRKSGGRVAVIARP